jgi:NAD(P)-dependent dehydrogenase (short-subunit alcohol dehydrogenase family)
MKVAIITGGNRGIDKSAELNVARKGTGVILTYQSHPEETAAVVAEIKVESIS